MKRIILIAAISYVCNCDSLHGNPPINTPDAPLLASDASSSRANNAVVGVAPARPAPAPTPIFRIHINGSFVQALAGKTRKEIQASLGWPVCDRGSCYLYQAKVPALWGEANGYLLVYFAKGQARAFQVNSKSPLDRTFVRLALQNAPGARFAPNYQPSNLTGSDWRDAQNGFWAATEQATENEHLLTIDLTPWSDRGSSPFAQPAKAR